MGTWGPGPFDNDPAADFLGEADGTVSSMSETFERCVRGSNYLEVDDGQAAVAAAEIVALGFGYGDPEKAPVKARAIARTIGPNEKLRLQALRALVQVRDKKRSEVAGLWEESNDDEFFTGFDGLVARLTEAGD